MDLMGGVGLERGIRMSLCTRMLFVGLEEEGLLIKGARSIPVGRMIR